MRVKKFGHFIQEKQKRILRLFRFCTVRPDQRPVILFQPRDEKKVVDATDCEHKRFSLEDELCFRPRLQIAASEEWPPAGCALAFSSKVKGTTPRVRGRERRRDIQNSSRRPWLAALLPNACSVAHAGELPPT